MLKGKKTTEKKSSTPETAIPAVDQQGQFSLAAIAPEMRHQVYPHLSASPLVRFSSTCKFFRNELQGLIETAAKRESIKATEICDGSLFEHHHDGRLVVKYQGSDTFEIPNILKGKFVKEIRLYQINAHQLLFILATPGLYVYGSNFSACLGVGGKLQAVTKVTEIPECRDKEIIELHCHDFSTICRYKDGITQGIFAWGLSKTGHLGLGHHELLETHPKSVSFIEDISQVKIVSNHRRSFFIFKKKTYACGLNRNGQLGLGHTNPVNTPTEVIIMIDGEQKVITDVVTDQEFTLFICEDCICVVGNSIPGIPQRQAILIPTKLPGFDNKSIHKVEMSSAFCYMFIFCKDEDDKVELYVQGDNTSGNLGLKDLLMIVSPTKVTTKKGGNFYDVKLLFGLPTGQQQYSAVLMSEEGPYGCGNNELRQINAHLPLSEKIVLTKLFSNKVLNIMMLPFVDKDKKEFISFYLNEDCLYASRMDCLFFKKHPQQNFAGAGIRDIKIVTAIVCFIGKKETFVSLYNIPMIPKELVFLQNKQLLDVRLSKKTFDFFCTDGVYSLNMLDLIRALSNNHAKIELTPTRIFNPYLPSSPPLRLLEEKSAQQDEAANVEDRPEEQDKGLEKDAGRGCTIS